jgi:hypothetical protein
VTNFIWKIKKSLERGEPPAEIAGWITNFFNFQHAYRTSFLAARHKADADTSL